MRPQNGCMATRPSRLLGDARLSCSDRRCHQNREPRSSRASKKGRCFERRRSSVGRTAPLWSDVTSIAKRNADGTVAGFVAISRDITARKRADERFRLAVEAAPAAMIMVDQRGAIVMVNALTDQLLGYTRSEIIGQSIELLVPVRFRIGHKDDRGHFFRNAH